MSGVVRGAIKPSVLKPRIPKPRIPKPAKLVESKKPPLRTREIPDIVDNDSVNTTEPYSLSKDDSQEFSETDEKNSFRERQTPQSCGHTNIWTNDEGSEEESTMVTRWSNLFVLINEINSVQLSGQSGMEFIELHVFRKTTQGYEKAPIGTVLRGYTLIIIHPGQHQ